MPVAPLAPSAPTAPVGSTETAPPTAGFADLLASQASAATGGSIADLPTVTLAQMIRARTAPPQVPGVPQGGLGDLDAPNRPGRVGPGVTERPRAGRRCLGRRQRSAGRRVRGARSSRHRRGRAFPRCPLQLGWHQRVHRLRLLGLRPAGVRRPGRLAAARQHRPVAGRLARGQPQARPGDRVFWRGGGGRPNHIGIDAGDGKMLVAPRTGDVVRYQDITRTPDDIRRIIT